VLILGLGLLFWQMAVCGHRQTVASVLLAFSVAAATASHYYAGLQIAFPLAAREFVHT
jgi:hypothetical protein